jgi:hypothetical protein
MMLRQSIKWCVLIYVVSLAACGGSQPPISAPSAMSQSRVIAGQAGFWRHPAGGALFKAIRPSNGKTDFNNGVVVSALLIKPALPPAPGAPHRERGGLAQGG